LLQADSGLAEALAECDFGERGERAQIADAPEIEKFEQARGVLQVGFLRWRRVCRFAGVRFCGSG